MCRVIRYHNLILDDEVQSKTAPGGVRELFGFKHLIYLPDLCCNMQFP